MASAGEIISSSELQIAQEKIVRLKRTIDAKNVKLTNLQGIVDGIWDNASDEDLERLSEILSTRVAAELAKMKSHYVAPPSVLAPQSTDAHGLEHFVDNCDVPILKKFLKSVLEKSKRSSQPTHHQQTIYNTLSLQLASMYDYVLGTSFYHPFMWMMAYIVKGVAHSRFVSNLVGSIIPGFPSDKRLTEAAKKFAKNKAIEHIGLKPATLSSQLIFVHDNIGNYTRATSRAGQLSGRKNPIASALLLFEVRHPKTSRFHNLQEKMLEGPGYWKPRNQAPSDFYKPTEAHEQYFVNEKILCCTTHHDKIGEYIATGKCTAHLRMGSESEVDDDDQDTKMEVKVCPTRGCSLTWSKNYKQCICGAKLPTIAEVRAMTTNDATEFMGRCSKPPAQTTPRYDHIVGVSGDDKSVQLTAVPISSEDAKSSSSVSSSSTLPLPPPIKVIKHSLPPKLVNPGANAAILKLYEVYRRLGVLPDKINTPVKFWAYFSCDVGALYSKPLDDPDDLNFNLVYLLGQGHEMFFYGRIIMKLIFHIGGAALAVLHTFVSQAAQEYLERCGNNHKAADFMLDVFRPACLQHLSCAFRAENPADVSSGAFLNWLEDDQNDSSFKSFKMLAVDVLSAYNMVYVGCRSRNYDVYDAGRRQLLPFVFTFGSINYAPVLMRDLVIFEYQITDLCKEHRREIFCRGAEGEENGQSYDLIMEENIRIMKRNMVGNQTGEGYIVTSHLVEVMDDFRSTVTAECGLKIAKIKHRTDNQLEKDQADCLRYLNAHSSAVKARDREQPLKIGGKPFKQGTGVHEIRNVGVENLKKYSLVFLLGEPDTKHIQTLALSDDAGVEIQVENILTNILDEGGDARDAHNKDPDNDEGDESGDDGASAAGGSEGSAAASDNACYNITAHDYTPIGEAARIINVRARVTTRADDEGDGNDQDANMSDAGDNVFACVDSRVGAAASADNDPSADDNDSAPPTKRRRKSGDT